MLATAMNVEVTTVKAHVGPARGMSVQVMTINAHVGPVRGMSVEVMTVNAHVGPARSMSVEVMTINALVGLARGMSVEVMTVNAHVGPARGMMAIRGAVATTRTVGGTTAHLHLGGTRDMMNPEATEPIVTTTKYAGETRLYYRHLRRAPGLTTPDGTETIVALKVHTSATTSRPHLRPARGVVKPIHLGQLVISLGQRRFVGERLARPRHLFHPQVRIRQEAIVSVVPILVEATVVKQVKCGPE